jgi:hypothetical protein
VTASLSASPDAKKVSAASVLWLPLGELLVERGLLSKAQLDLALAERQRTGLRLGEVLVSLGYVSEAALASTLLEQIGLPLVPADAEPAEARRAPIEAPLAMLRRDFEERTRAIEADLTRVRAALRSLVEAAS